MMYADESSSDEREAICAERRDVDLEMARMHAEADAWHAVRDRGYCNHGSALGYLDPPAFEAQKLIKPGQLICNAGCGTIFADDADWYAQLDDPMANPVPLPVRAPAPAGV